jgi:hypothetical protein
MRYLWRRLPAPIRRTGKIVITSVLQGIQRPSAQISLSGKVRTYCVPGHEVFQGYYDIVPFNTAGSALLAHATTVKRRSPRRDDHASVGYFDRDEHRFTSVAETNLWCWQVGARLCWWPEHELGLAFNHLVGSKPSFCYAEPGRKPVPIANRPLFDVTHRRDKGLALNFGRLAYARPGYGYSAIPDPVYGEELPETDGVWIVDLLTGSDILVASVRDIAALAPAFPDKGFHYLNAASFNPSGEYFSVLHKRLRTRKRVDNWEGRAVIGTVEGTDLHVVPLPGRPSHYWWLDEKRIAYSVVPPNRPHRCEFLLYDVAHGSIHPMHPATPEGDGHPSYHPTGRWIIDGYPDLRGRQPLYVLEPTGSRTEIAMIRADPRYQGEWRCDLHPRWSRDGRTVVVDSSHRGYRTISEVEIPSPDGKFDALRSAIDA